MTADDIRLELVRAIGWMEPNLATVLAGGTEWDEVRRKLSVQFSELSRGYVSGNGVALSLFFTAKEWRMASWVVRRIEAAEVLDVRRSDAVSECRRALQFDIFSPDVTTRAISAARFAEARRDSAIFGELLAVDRDALAEGDVEVSEFARMTDDAEASDGELMIDASGGTWWSFKTEGTTGRKIGRAVTGVTNERRLRELLESELTARVLAAIEDGALFRRGGQTATSREDRAEVVAGLQRIEEKRRVKINGAALALGLGCSRPTAFDLLREARSTTVR